MAQAARTKDLGNYDLERKIRSDLNLEKLAIWKLTNSNLKNFKRTFEDEVILENGEKVLRKLEIMSVGDLGLLTTEDQKTYYALIEQWQEHGRSDGYTAFSLRKIAKRLGKKWSSTTYQTLLNSLLRLRGILFIWTNSYYNSETDETEELIDTFTILPVLKIFKKKKNEAVHGERAYYKFHDLILSNIKNNYSKPVILPIHFGIKNETAQLLYGLLDRVLSKKNFLYQKRSAELFDELGLEGSKYKYRSGRKQTLDRAVKELEGLPMSNGAFLKKVSVEETKDKKDFNLIVRRSRIEKNSQLPPKDSIKTPEGDDKAQYGYSKTFKPDTFAEKLICEFESKILEVEPQQPKKQHLKIVNRWIEEFGESGAETIVEDAIEQLHSTREKYHSFGIVKEISRKSIAKIKKRQREIKQTEIQKREQADFQLTKEIFITFSETKQNKLRQKYEKKFKKIHKLTRKDFEKNPYLEADMSNYAGEKIQEEILNKYKK